MDPSTSLRLWYVLLFLSLGAFHPYLAVYLRSRGLDGDRIALVLAAFPLVRVGSPLLWGRLADRGPGPAALLRLLALVSAATGAGLAWCHGFPAFVLASAALGLFQSPLFSLLDSLALSAGPALDLDFGRLRAAGSLGFLVGVVLGGRFLEGDAIRYAPLGLALPLVLLAFSGGRQGAAPPPAPPVPPPAPTPPTAEVPAALAHLHLHATLYYACHAGFDAYFASHCEELGLGTGIAGLGWGLAIMAEVLLLSRAGKLYARFGAARLIDAACLAGVVRWALLAWLRHPTAIVAAQVLHALTFGLWAYAVVRETDRLATPETKATAQGRLASAAYGIGFGLGSLVWGGLRVRLGSPATFGIMAATQAVLLLLARLHRNRCPREPPPGEASRSDAR